MLLLHEDHDEVALVKLDDALGIFWGLELLSSRRILGVILLREAKGEDGCSAEATTLYLRTVMQRTRRVASIVFRNALE